MSFLSFDFSWRKIKQDLQSELTEASVTGSIASIIVGLFMFYLVVSQVADYRTLKSETNVVLDHYSHAVSPTQDNAEDTMQINFNITFPHLSCEFASVDATNFMGTHDAGLASRVSKVHLDKQGRQVGVHQDRAAPNVHQDNLEPLGPHKETQTSIELGADGFEAQRKHVNLLIVNFCTPWAHWCKKLEPVWEKASAAVEEKYRDSGLIAFAHVDCSEGKASQLCSDKHVDAFPTIMVFRKEDRAESDHERFHAERSVDSLIAWADHLVEDVKKGPDVPREKVVDVDKDGDKESHHGVGCLIAGMLHVQRAPGGIQIQAKSDGHEFNWATMDVSHVVNHLSFGPFLTETAWKVMPPHVAQAVGSLDNKKFSSERHIPTTHEHMIKVVKNVVELPSNWHIPPVVAHGYTAHSNNIQRFAEVPSVRINYDILPILVHIKSSYKTFYYFVTQLCAILGGVFTVTGIVSAGVDVGVKKMLKKEQLGKLG